MSSSAQLTLLPWLAGWEPPADRTRFAAGLHAGSALGLALAHRENVRQLRPDEVRRLILSAAPAAIAGLVLQGPVDRRLGKPVPTAVLMALSAGVLWVADRQAEVGPGPRSQHQALTGNDLRAASLAQVTALVPGVSRAGASLTAFRARGVDREVAVRTSTLMSLPVTLGAAGLTSLRGRQAPALVPTALAGVSAYAVARRAATGRSLVTASVIYRFALAAVVPLAAARRRKELR